MYACTDLFDFGPLFWVGVGYRTQVVEQGAEEERAPQRLVEELAAAGQLASTILIATPVLWQAVKVR